MVIKVGTLTSTEKTKEISKQGTIVRMDVGGEHYKNKKEEGDNMNTGVEKESEKKISKL